MDHYFRPRPDLESRPTAFTVTVAGRTLRFRTDRGVFSRGGLDAGSRLLIETVTLDPGARLLDLGAGYGAVGLALKARFPDARVTMIDINPRAAALAEHNAAQNGFSDVRVFVGDGIAPVAGERFDAVVINPPIRAGKAVVFRLYREAHDALVPGGALWAVVHKKHGAPSHRTALQALFGEAAVVRRERGYHILQAIKRA
ncbi:methyltransferase [Hydrogenibacillus sp. N12]|uniref:class I SAM-dependent methyltransferase n=1 Tax=Hydrogenibacillus sp. N12 TaxID=2866627 RepID=UPI001C7DC9C9|nr:methyltransferase [Hydrogenibacillus sp. N12]QZA33117.1 methyltransferase [Hydrogenibacillus sp. N12]